MKTQTFIKVLPQVAEALQAVKVRTYDLEQGIFGIEVYVPNGAKFNPVRNFLEAIGFDFMNELELNGKTVDYFGLQTDNQMFYDLAKRLDDGAII